MDAKPKYGTLQRHSCFASSAHTYYQFLKCRKQSLDKGTHTYRRSLFGFCTICVWTRVVNLVCHEKKTRGCAAVNRSCREGAHSLLIYFSSLVAREICSLQKSLALNHMRSERRWQPRSILIRGTRQYHIRMRTQVT